MKMAEYEIKFSKARLNSHPGVTINHSAFMGRNRLPAHADVSAGVHTADPHQPITCPECLGRAEAKLADVARLAVESKSRQEREFYAASAAQIAREIRCGEAHP
jgi:hypothetical protein